MIALRGLVAVVVGLAVLFFPRITLDTLVLLFGAYALLDGVFAIAAATANRVAEERTWELLGGITGVVAGVATFLWPNITALVLLYLIAAWAIVTGILEILAASELHKEIECEWLLALSGLASLVFGVLVALRPQAGGLALTWLLGLYAIVSGMLILLFASRLWDVNKRMDSLMVQGN